MSKGKEYLSNYLIILRIGIGSVVYMTLALLVPNHLNFRSIIINLLVKRTNTIETS